MPSAAFTTLGCKVNQYETQRILESFEASGFAIVPFNEPADVYVINTCSVTAQAESKSWQTVRRATRNNPNAKVIVTGCASQMAHNMGGAIDADLHVPNPDKLRAFAHFSTAFPELCERARNEPSISTPSRGRTRATVKIQDGCSVYCSYCSIPYTRPVMHSRAFDEVFEEVRQLSRRGYKEVVLTGVLIGSYGPDTGSGGPDFEDLVSDLSSIDGIERLRISSIEMTQVSDRLIDLMCAPKSKVVPHLHVPLQSGSSRVLRDMNRPYSKSDFIELGLRLKEQVPEIGLSTDIMVGFPTESEEDFRDTLDVCERVRFSKAHLFRFSPRIGTPAEKYGDPVSNQVKQDRVAALTRVTTETRREFFRKHIGRRVEVLVESKCSKSGMLRGHTPNYVEVEFAGPQYLVGTICAVKISIADERSASGELCSAQRLNPDSHALRVIH
jgi:threonylcarbamoyladenosine tRNA methylthiotransferase MtaB